MPKRKAEAASAPPHSTPFNAMAGSLVDDNAEARRFPMAADLAYRSYISSTLWDTFLEDIPEVVTQEHVIDLRKKLKKRMARQNRYLTPHDLLRYADLIRATYLGIRNALHTPPRLCNTDGDPFLFHTLTFRIESAEAAFEALASLAVGRSREELFDDAELDEGGKLRSVDFDWIREGNRKFKSWDNTILGHIKISAK